MTLRRVGLHEEKEISLRDVIQEELPGVVDSHLNQIIQGDSLFVLRTLPSESVQMCVTSPPYWCLRDYGTAVWKGGDKICDHQEFRGGHGEASKLQVVHGSVCQYRNVCRKCGAVRVDKQIGLEKSPEEYTAKLVEIFREVRRVLRADGTLWLNLGDSYAGGCMSNPLPASTLGGGKDRGASAYSIVRIKPDGLKPKDLVGIPWRVAFALQADGWYLRSDIIWHKTNPMPESVTDRPTKAHEYLFLMSKSARYWYDAEAIKENASDCKPRPPKENRWEGQCGHETKDGFLKGTPAYFTRNRRSVWTIATQPFPGAHFATFPEALVRPCILAGCPEGGVVLDPFMGSGTVAVVCERLNRQWLGIELNQAYITIANKRLIRSLIRAKR